VLCLKLFVCLGDGGSETFFVCSWHIIPCHEESWHMKCLS